MEILQEEVKPEAYYGLADAICAVLGPMVEVALHDLGSDTLAYLAGAMSPRKIGEPSNLRDMVIPDEGGVIGPYDKTNWDGRRLRSISVVLPGATMLCVNVDVTEFETMRSLLDKLLRISPTGSSGDSALLLRHDWHETVNQHIAAWCAERGLNARTLNRDERRKLLGSIIAAGGFAAPRAVSYVATLLNLSRATLYNEIAKLKRDARAS